MSVRNSIRDAIRSAIGLVEEVFNPQTLFLSGKQGAWYDPSDLSTLFQDAAGTIPVTGMEQPVGLMLDKSKGLVRGPDSRDTGAPAAFGTPPSAATYNADGEGTASRTDGSNFSYVTFTGVTIGKSYEITVRNRGGSNLSVRTSSIGTVLFTVPAGATLTGRVVPAGLGALSVAPDTNGSSISFTVLSVRELPGNHATQATAAQRPILTARKNLLLNTHLSGGTAGTVGAGAVAPVGWVFPFTGGSVSYLTSQFGTGSVAFTKTLTTARPFIQQSIGVIASTTYTLSCRVSQAATGTMKIGDVCAWATLPAGSTQAYYKNGVLTTSSAIETLQLGDVISSVLTVSTTAGTVQARVGLGAAGDTSVTGTVSLTMPQIEVSVAPTRYQWVNTATDYDYAGFPIGLRCDGVDDGMVTGSIDFTGTDKMFVCAGVRKLSDAAAGMFLELSVDRSNNAGSFDMRFPESTSRRISALSRGSAPVSSTQQAYSDSSAYLSPVSLTISTINDIAGDSVLLRLGGALVSTATGDQGTGNYGNYPLYLFRRGGTSLPFNGLFYGAIIAGAAYSASQIASAERYLAGKSGVTV